MDERITDRPRPREERFAASPAPHREHPGKLRLECEPDRGRLLGWLARGSLLFALLSLLTFLPGLLGLPLAIATFVMARRDLARMQARLMDPRGRTAAECARDDAVIAVLLCLTSWLLMGPVLLVIKWDAVWDFLRHLGGGPGPKQSIPSVRG